MKKTMGIVGGMMLMAGCGYGAWALYKKYNPKASCEVEDMIKNVKDDALNKIKM